VRLTRVCAFVDWFPAPALLIRLNRVGKHLKMKGNAMVSFPLSPYHAWKRMPRALLGAMLVCWFVAFPAAGSSKYQEFSDFTTPLPLAKGDVLVLGIVGGWERWDRERIVRRLALDVRELGYAGVYAETVENHRMELARELLLKAWDRDGDGKLNADEKSSARLILYGQSLGGSAAVRYARELGEQGIPVLLLVTIDSYGHGDNLVPPNVAAALNVYQRDHLFIKGEGDFAAEDPSRTKILGNHRLRYRGKGVEDLGVQDYAEEPWIRRVFIGSHLKIEYDQRVRNMVREAIFNHIPADRREKKATAGGNAAATPPQTAAEP
jgi:pimeloyl-ACP methyl ester carboxylesterase